MAAGQLGVWAGEGDLRTALERSAWRCGAWRERYDVLLRRLVGREVCGLNHNVYCARILFLIQRIS